MAKEHLTKWAENKHEKAPGSTPCLWRHAKYGDGKFKRCDYRKNAHDAAEPNIYNVGSPGCRVDAEWVGARLSTLEPSRRKKDNKVIARTKPAAPVVKGPDGKFRPNGAWDLKKGANFTEWKTPYWHNTHHVISCGEIKHAFPTQKHQRRILRANWNINEMPNVIILPKQPSVATALKLPTHVPPDGKQEHEEYSAQLGERLGYLKGDLDQNASSSGHPTDDTNVDAVKTKLDRGAKAIRDFLLKCGREDPGVDLNTLDLARADWRKTGWPQPPTVA